MGLFRLSARPEQATEESSPVVMSSEFRSTLLELARWLVRLADGGYREFACIGTNHAKLNCKVELLNEACHMFAVALVQRALAPSVRHTTVPPAVLRVSEAAQARMAASSAAASSSVEGQPAPSPFATSMLPLEVVLKAYLLLARVAEQRTHLRIALEFLLQTFATAQLGLG